MRGGGNGLLTLGIPWSMSLVPQLALRNACLLSKHNRVRKFQLADLILIQFNTLYVLQCACLYHNIHIQVLLVSI